jgi:insulysin
MRSTKPRPKKVSSTASQVFLDLVRAAGVTIDEAVVKDTSNGDETPSASDFTQHWTAVLIGANVAQQTTQELLAAIPSLIDKYPVEGDGPDEPRAVSTYIKDVPAFKKGLAVSESAKPCVEWGDLPVSRL